MEALEGQSETSSQHDANRDLVEDEDDKRSESFGSRDGVIKSAWGRHTDVDVVPSREDNRQELPSLLTRSDTNNRNGESKSGKGVAKAATTSGPSEMPVATGGKERQMMSMKYIQELENALDPKKVGIIPRHFSLSVFLTVVSCTFYAVLCRFIPFYAGICRFMSCAR